MLPKTKIVCTIGPSSRSPETLDALIESGMSVARLNFSHGTHAEHGDMLQHIRQAAERAGRSIAVLQDLAGPKIRVGEIPGSGLRLSAGDEVVLTTDPRGADEHRIPVTYSGLPAQVRQGDRILLADGLMEIVVQRITANDIHCQVITGGLLTSHKGINLPSSTLDIPAMTEKDRRDLLFGLDMGVDYVALSFVRTAADIHAVKKIIHRQNKRVPVIAKIEKHEAVKNMDAILAAADGVMVARGDLGVEIPLEQVPHIQKILVAKANALAKPVIIATQMLRSMVASPRPTRAEAADVANAVLDGADAVMLSEESAVGDYPVEAVRFMARIAVSTEQHYPHDHHLLRPPQQETAEAVAYAACVLAQQLDAAAVVATTRSGSTAIQISRYRPAQPVVALCPDEAAARRMALFWGCVPCRMDIVKDTDDMVDKAAETTLEKGLARKGQKVVITAGRPIWAEGTTNMLWVKTL